MRGLRTLHESRLFSPNSCGFSLEFSSLLYFFLSGIQLKKHFRSKLDLTTNTVVKLAINFRLSKAFMNHLKKQ